MKRAILMAGALVAAVWSLPAQAVMICDCCAKDRPELCTGPCKEAAQPICTPVILPDVRGWEKTNPLLRYDLKYLELNGLTPQQLEKVRRWAEKQRRRAEREYRRMRARAIRGRISREAFRKAEARRDKVVVNYQHIIRAYRTAKRQD